MTPFLKQWMYAIGRQNREARTQDSRGRGWLPVGEGAAPSSARLEGGFLFALAPFNRGKQPPRGTRRTPRSALP